MTRFQRFVTTVAVSALIACGGSTTTPVDDSGAATIGIVQGDGQFAVAQTAVQIPPAVVVTDAKHRPVAGVPVTFTVTLGGGRLEGPIVATDASGRAQVGKWILGSKLGAQAVTASTPSVHSIAAFGATAYVGAPATMTVLAGDAQTGARGSVLPIALSVQVRDAVGNLIPGAVVRFQPLNSTSTATPSQVTTDSSGVAGGVRWKLDSSNSGFTAGLTAITGTVTASFHALLSGS